MRKMARLALLLEKKLKIAYLGPQGTYSELAARVLFGHMVDLVPCYSLEEVLEKSEDGSAGDSATDNLIRLFRDRSGT